MSRKIIFKNQLGEVFYKKTVLYYYYYSKIDNYWVFTKYDPKEEGELNFRKYKASIKHLFTEGALTKAGALILFSKFVDKYKSRIEKAGVKNYTIREEKEE